MALPNSGPISLNDIQTEFGGSNPISISEYYGVASGVPASGTISFDDFYGTSSGLPPVSLGYFIGGYLGSTAPPTTRGSNKIHRIQYSNDTISLIPATLSEGRSNSAAVQNTTYGYICGGIRFQQPSNVYFNRIDRFQFSNETSSNPPVNLPSSRGGQLGLSSSSKGFICGGYIQPTPSPSSGTYFSNIVELNLSNGTVSNPSTTLSGTRGLGAQISDVNNGYLLMGILATPTSAEVDKMNFSNQTISTIANTAITGSPFYNASFSNRSGGKGYVFGGFKSGSYPGLPFYSQAVERLQYSNDTFTLIPAATPVIQRSAVGNFSDNAGYIAGSFISPTNAVQKFAFSNETFASPVGAYPIYSTDMCSNQI
tara:strand:+ start:78 stop:1184 length:1107 start_codon:yes stop_codon:yes gene_type:complete